ncbi:hypothetical protein FJY68_01870 [candidate division WOR-3 bacterium]|uniref:Photosynthesis system II assembly factor Ycf48/Hcf136-like domain-containing protein n=1 Tax=candidate division WOR-3 bacterium TaxID=2052148 RepID=A0A938BT47_UNCW3|nr:hypothetical protein [candidate division WOR-3 bacterium]
MLRWKISFLTCVVLCAMAAADWSYRCPLPTGNDLFAVQHVQANTWLVSGAGGTVLKTTDNGASWSDHGAYGRPYAFRRIHFPADTLTGFVLGRSGDGGRAVFRTTDGGRNWTMVLSNILYRFEDICFSSDTRTGLAVGYFPGSPESTVVFRTIDSGVTWTRSEPREIGRLYGVLLLADDRTGYAAGNLGTSGGVVFRTTDAGVTWNRVAGPVGHSLTHISFPVDGQTGYAVGNYGLVLKTTDAGLSWDSSGFQSGWNSIGAGFRDNQTGFVLMGVYNGGAQTRHRTTDGGATWSEDTTSSFYPTSLDFAADGEHVLMTGLAGDLKLSSDTGRTWFDLARRVTRHTLTGVSFPTGPESGYMASDFGGLFATGDYGQNWMALGAFDSTYLFTEIVFPGGPETGFVSGRHGLNRGVVCRTTDEGVTWDSVLGSSGSTFSDLSFPTGETGYARAGNLVYRTTDAGSTWSPRHTGTSATYLDMDFCCADTGMLVGEWGAVARTTDAGQTWSVVNAGMTDDLYAVSLLPGGQDVHVCGSDRYFARSTDGGETWQGEFIGSSSDCLYDITFPAGADTGYMVGERDIFRTTDQGATWTSQFPTSALLMAVCFPVDCRNGYAVGTGGTVVATGDAGGAVHETPHAERRTPSGRPTIIRGVLRLGSRLAASGPQRAELLDMSGRKVMHLVPGENSIRHLTSGVYVVRRYQSGRLPTTSLTKVAVVW